MSDHDSNTLTFEEAYAQLEEIAGQLESGDLTLDESVTLYERGQALAQLCGERLDSAELRIQQIGDTGEIGPLK